MFFCLSFGCGEVRKGWPYVWCLRLVMSSLRTVSHVILTATSEVQEGGRDYHWLYSWGNWVTEQVCALSEACRSRTGQEAHSTIVLKWTQVSSFFLILTRGHFFFIALRERMEREKQWCEKEASIGCLLYVPRLGIAHAQTGDQTRNLGMYPDWELNLKPFGYRTVFQPTEPHWPGQKWTQISSAK